VQYFILLTAITLFLLQYEHCLEFEIFLLAVKYTYLLSYFMTPPK